MDLTTYLKKEIGRIPEIVKKQYEITKGVLELTWGWSTGSGDSFAAALSLQYLTSYRFTPADPLELATLNPSRGEQLVAISVKGRTIKVIESAEKLREKGVKVIAVTAYPDSPLAEKSDTVIKLVYPGGELPVGIGNYVAVLTALGTLAGYSLEGVMEAYNLALQAPLPEETKDIVTIGENEGYVNALFTCLKLYEMACKPCRCYRLEQFLHASIYSLTPNTTLIFFGSKASKEVGKLLEDEGYKVTIVDFQSNTLGNLIAGAVYATRLADKVSREMGFTEPCYKTRRKLVEETTKIIYK